jgi:hypothetical protein
MLLCVLLKGGISLAKLLGDILKVIIYTMILSASFHTSHDFRENSVIISVRILFYLDKLWKLLVMEWLKYFEAAP